MARITLKTIIQSLFFFFIFQQEINVKKKLNKNEFEIIDILEMVQITYSDGKKDIFEAIHIADEGVFTGRIRNDKVFINGGFIPKENIKKIIGGIKRKIRKRKSIF